MTAQSFIQSLSEEAPPADLTTLHQALWFAGKGEWDKAHQIAQQYEGDRQFDQLHAYLHRVEGDEGNARYWYRRAETILPEVSIEKEFAQLVQTWVNP